MKQIINCESNEIVERELSDEELLQQIEDEKSVIKAKGEEAKKAKFREAVLDRLGLTEEEAKALFQ